MSTISDINIYGEISSNGLIKSVHDDEAIINALIFYLTSNKGDYIPEPQKGGLLRYLLYKPLYMDIESMEFFIENEIKENFSDYITLDSVRLTPNTQAREWEITINFTSKLSNKDLTAAVYVDYEANQEIEKQEASVTIDYTGENLYNFVLLMQPDQVGEKLLFDNDLELWVWGKYTLINFNQDDTYFDLILKTINT